MLFSEFLRNPCRGHGGATSANHARDQGRHDRKQDPTLPGTQTRKQDHSLRYPQLGKRAHVHEYGQRTRILADPPGLDPQPALRHAQPRRSLLRARIKSNDEGRQERLGGNQGFHQHTKSRQNALSYYSHSIVAGGLLVMSYTTRFTPGTSATMRPEMRARTS